MANNANELARVAAQDLAADFGDGLRSDVEAAIEAPEQNLGKPKSFGVIETITIAYSVLQAADLAWQLYQAGHNKIAIINGLEDKLETPPDLSLDKRKTLIEAIVDKLFSM